ncbi:aldose epimerase [Cohnella hongkongensis]|uniref:Aldose epimerase n=1 Tax=Cohnella hongkongensis TaxID=178337 RepID=A0ABV9FKJ6_9BACL
MTANASYSLRTYNDGFPLYELREPGTDSSFVVCPERGGIVTSCRLHGQELFYLDRETFLNPQANIRGGNPVLFPIAGQLVNGEYEWNGRTYRMKNHGVARTSAWEVAKTETDNEASITLSLRSNEDTRAEYPFEFELLFTYRLQNGVLTIDQTYRNLSEEPMPMVAGFHPYFATESKNLTYRTDATRMYDYNDKQEKPFDGYLKLEGMVESAALLNADKPEISFPLSGGRSVRLSYSEPFRYIVLWSVEGKPFVCVEPWTALNEALNNKKELLMVDPGQSLALSLSFELRD